MADRPVEFRHVAGLGLFPADQRAGVHGDDRHRFVPTARARLFCQAAATRGVAETEVAEADFMSDPTAVSGRPSQFGQKALQVSRRPLTGNGRIVEVAIVET